MSSGLALLLILVVSSTATSSEFFFQIWWGSQREATWPWPWPGQDKARLRPSRSPSSWWILFNRHGGHQPFKRRNQKRRTGWMKGPWLSCPTTGSKSAPSVPNTLGSWGTFRRKRLWGQKSSWRLFFMLWGEASLPGPKINKCRETKTKLSTQELGCLLVFCKLS